MPRSGSTGTPRTGPATPGHVAVDPSDERTVYVATYQAAVSRSTDGGATGTTLKDPA